MKSLFRKMAVPVAAYTAGLQRSTRRSASALAVALLRRVPTVESHRLLETLRARCRQPKPPCEAPRRTLEIPLEVVKIYQHHLQGEKWLLRIDFAPHSSPRPPHALLLRAGSTFYFCCAARTPPIPSNELCSCRQTRTPSRMSQSRRSHTRCFRACSQAMAERRGMVCQLAAGADATAEEVQA